MRRFHHYIGLFVISCILLSSKIAGAQFAVHVGDHGFRPVRQVPSAPADRLQPGPSVSERQPQHRYAAYQEYVPIPTHASQPMYFPPQAAAIAFPGGPFDDNAAALPFAAPRRRPVTTPVLGSRTRRTTARNPFPMTAPLHDSPSDLSKYALTMPDMAFNPDQIHSGIPSTPSPYTQNPNSAVSLPSHQPPVAWNVASPPQLPPGNFGMALPPATSHAGVVSPAYSPAGFPPSVQPQTATQQNAAQPATANAAIHVYPPNVRLRN